MLCGTGWTACNTIMSLSNDNVKYDFSHNDELKLPAWYQHKVISWRKCNNMRDAFQRI